MVLTSPDGSTTLDTKSRPLSLLQPTFTGGVSDKILFSRRSLNYDIDETNKTPESSEEVEPIDNMEHFSDNDPLSTPYNDAMFDETINTCPVCARIFTNRSDLVRHTRIHTGEKPFTCPFCDYRSNQRPNVSRHIKIKHPDRF